MIDSVSIRQLRYLIKIVETGSMTRAASELNISQPALGLQIKKLEDSVGLQLLLRHSRGVVPTPAGKYLYDKSKAIVDLLVQTRRDLRMFSSAASDRAMIRRERISLGLTPSIIRQVGASMLIDLQLSNPHVLLNVVESFSKEMEAHLLQNRIDVGFAYDIDLARFPRPVPILDENFVLYTPGSGTGSISDIPAKQIFSQKLVLQSSHDFVRRTLEAVSREHRLELQIPFEVHSADAIKTIVENNLAAAVVPYGSVAEAVRAGKARVRRIVEPEITRRLYLIRAPHGRKFEDETGMTSFLARSSEKIVESLGRFGKRVNAGDAALLAS